jgi:hypothetical protein
LNPAGERKVERFGWTFAPGDKVMQIENDYDKEVYNGDIGYIDDVDPDMGYALDPPRPLWDSLFLLMEPPESVTAADALTKLRRRLVGDDRVSFRRRVECPSRCPAREIQYAEGALIEVILGPLVDGEKDVVQRAEEPCAASIRFEAPGGKRQERRWIARTGARERARSRHMHGFGVGCAA